MGYVKKPGAILQVGPARKRSKEAIAAQLKPLQQRRKYSKKMVRAALIAANGIMTQAAKRLGCSRGTIAFYLDRHPDLDLEMQQIRESYVDLAESSLLTQVAEKNTQATLFLLRSLGRKRGWVDSPQEHIHAIAPVGSGTWLDIMKRAMANGELPDSNAIDLDPRSCTVKTLPAMEDDETDKEPE